MKTLGITGCIIICLVLEVVNVHGQSYYEKYGPGSEKRPSNSKTVINPKGSSGNRRPGSKHHSYSYEYSYESKGPKSGSNRYRPANTNDRYETDRNGCPTVKNGLDRKLNYCLMPLNRLEGRRTSTAEKCRAYKEAKPCVAGVEKCKRENPRLGGFTRGELWKKWESMKREAEVYGLCADVLV